MACCAILLILFAIAWLASGHGSYDLAMTSSGSGIALFIGIACFVSGLIGWLLVMKKDVLQCDNCGAVVNASATTNRSAGRARKAALYFLVFIGVTALVAAIHFFVDDYRTWSGEGISEFDWSGFRSHLPVLAFFGATGFAFTFLPKLRAKFANGKSTWFYRSTFLLLMLLSVLTWVATKTAQLGAINSPASNTQTASTSQAQTAPTATIAEPAQATPDTSTAEPAQPTPDDSVLEAAQSALRSAPPLNAKTIWDYGQAIKTVSLPDGNTVTTTSTGQVWITLRTGWKGRLQTGKLLKGFLFQVQGNVPYTSTFTAVILTALPESDVVGAPSTELTEIQADCASRTYRNWATWLFTEQGIPVEDNGPEEAMRRVEEGTQIWYVFDMLCKTPAPDNHAAQFGISDLPPESAQTTPSVPAANALASENAIPSNESVTPQPETKKNAPQTDAQYEGTPEERIDSLLNDWVESFRQKDVAKQVGCYAPEVDIYYRAHNVSRAFVEADKSRAIARLAGIQKFELSNVKINLDSADAATVTFDKTWDTTLTSGRRYAGSEMERLRLALIDGGWRIKSEEEVTIHYITR